jgi:hypothetical protein
MVDSNPETEDNKENVDLKEEEVSSKFSKYSMELFKWIYFLYCPGSFTDYSKELCFEIIHKQGLRRPAYKLYC